jgi:hypothetical protein
MNTRFLFFVFVLLVINISAATVSAAPPTITIGGATAGDPATVYVTGQTQAINVAWNAGTDHTYCEIYYTTNGANQTELGRGHDGSKPVTFAIGSTFEFWMVVYPGSGQYSVVAKLNVVAKSSGLPPPKEPAPSKTGTGGFDQKARPKANTIEDFRNAPFISDVVVRPDYRNVVISFASTQSTPPLVEIAKVPPSNTTAGLKAFPGDAGAFGRFATEHKFRYILDADAQGQQLDVGTTYYYIVNVFNNNRNDSKRPREQFVGQFNTLRQSVKVVWERIHMTDDSDDLSTAECFFWFWANFSHSSGVYTDYMNNDMDSGENYNFDRTVFIPNAPDKLVLHASGQDADGTTAFTPSPKGGNNGNAPLSGAGDHSVWGSENSDTNAVAQEFDLASFPGDKHSVPFRLETRGGSLKFIVFGHFEITRGSAIETLGTAVSALQTPPPPETVKSQGGVKVDERSTRTTPLTKCEAAREARAKNNPAAAGLEAQCREEQAIDAIAHADPPVASERAQQSICESPLTALQFKNPAASGVEQKCLASIGEDIAEQDATLLLARRAEADPNYKFGFDVATAIFGDMAFGAQGNTLTGPGSMRIRGGLTAAGQRGFDAAVRIHLSRNYGK